MAVDKAQIDPLCTVVVQAWFYSTPTSVPRARLCAIFVLLWNVKPTYMECIAKAPT